MSDQSAAKPKRGMLTWAVWGAAIIGVAAVVYIIAQSSSNPAETTNVAKAPPAAASGPASVASKLKHPADGSAPPDYAFNDADGKPMKLADLKGKVVVLNLWATWCAPCQAEMPTLAKLQASYAGKPVEVVAISIDKPEALAQAKAFIAKQPPLAFYNDPDAKLPWALKPGAEGIPTTVIYGADGLERGRVSGDADWTTAKEVVDRVLTEAG